MGTELVDGIIYKAYGGFYFVSGGGDSWRCTLRGVLRRRGIEVLVGDRVSFRPGSSLTGVVEKVHPRSNALARPPVANVDLAVIVFAVRDPEPSLALLDRFLVQAEFHNVRPVVCINKIDLKGETSPAGMEAYSAAGYLVIETSAKSGAGIKLLREAISGGLTVFAGPSGVGKSSLLNEIQPGLSLKTGEVGEKIKRGRHTTRHVELIALAGGGLMADTPGFSSLYLPEIKREELAFFFPEMARYHTGCRFSGCLHKTEPDCSVKKAVSAGELDAARYDRYLAILDGITGRERS